MNRRGFFATIAAGLTALVAGRVAPRVRAIACGDTVATFDVSKLSSGWYRRYLTSMVGSDAIRVRYKADGKVLRIVTLDGAVLFTWQWHRIADARDAPRLDEFAPRRSLLARIVTGRT